MTRLPEWLDPLYVDEEPPAAPYQDDDLARRDAEISGKIESHTNQ